jgi:hypothetical protein
MRSLMENASDRRDGFEMEDWRSGFGGFFQVQSEVEGPVVEVGGVDEGLVDGQAVFGEAGVAGFGIEADLVAGGVVGVELLEEALVGPNFC